MSLSLMREHILLTQKFGEAIYANKGTTMILTKLDNNARKFAQALKSKRFLSLLRQHNRYAANFIVASLNCPCYVKRRNPCRFKKAKNNWLKKLIENGRKVVNELHRLFPHKNKKRISSLWTEHLTCTARYVRKLKCSPWPQYVKAKQDCLLKGKNMILYLSKN